MSVAGLFVSAFNKLACQSGAWKPAMSDTRFGGAYGWTNNPQTGAKSCPAGYSATYMGFNYGDGSGNPARFYICQK